MLYNGRGVAGHTLLSSINTIISKIIRNTHWRINRACVYFIMCMSIMIIFAIFTKTWHTWRVPVPVVTEALFRESRGQSPLSGSGHHPLNIGFLCWWRWWWWCVVVRCVAPLHVAAVAIVTP